MLCLVIAAPRDAGASRRVSAHPSAVESEATYFLIIVLGLPLLFLLLTGPGMWSETWGWRVMERLERSLDRLFRRKP